MYIIVNWFSEPNISFRRNPLNSAMAAPDRILPYERRKVLYRFLPNFDTILSLHQAEAIAHSILPYTNRLSPNFTLHDVNHSIRVIEYINQIIEATKEEKDFTDSEIIALYISGWLHDIGMIKGRDMHAMASAIMIEKLEKNWLMLRHLSMPVEEIVKHHSHCTSADIEKLKTKIRIDGKDFNLRRACAILRLADESDMTLDRAPPAVDFLLKDDFDDKAKLNWGANQSIKSIDYIPDDNVILIQVSSIKSAFNLLMKFNIELTNMKGFISEEFACRELQIQDPTGRQIRFPTHPK